MKISITIGYTDVAGLDERALKSEIQDVLGWSGIVYDDLTIEIGDEACVTIDGGTHNPVVEEVFGVVRDVISGMRSDTEVPIVTVADDDPAPTHDPRATP